MHYVLDPNCLFVPNWRNGTRRTGDDSFFRFIPFRITNIFLTCFSLNE